jgi:hypothetical protein
MRTTVLVSAATSSVVSVVAILVVMLLVQPPGADAQSRRVEAGEIRLVANDGTTRFSVEETRLGGADLRIVQNEVNRALLISGNRDAESVGFSLYDTAGGRRFWLALKQGPVVGTTGDVDGIAILDAQQRIRAHLGVDGSGEPFIVLFDAQGNAVWSAP